ncbi:MarR family transcriptional regulator [Haloarcula rubripromontorii]|uniref:MarR family transcriptional regulator n=1 Tax=Haloarcula rubripromontorii TaxID=1705562 RepID=UPI00345BDF67
MNGNRGWRAMRLFVGGLAGCHGVDGTPSCTSRRRLFRDVTPDTHNTCSRRTLVERHYYVRTNQNTLKVSKPGPDPTVTKIDVLKEIRLAYPPVQAPKDLAERLEISNTAVSNKLKDMEKNGWVESERVGRARVYWITDNGRAQLDPEFSSGNQ